MRHAYICAPFATLTLHRGEVLTPTINTRRACTLGAEAATTHYLPVVCVHPMILAGVYGSDDVPADREIGTRLTAVLAEQVGGIIGGELWILAYVDKIGRLFATPGMRGEIRAFLNGVMEREFEGRIHVWTWEGEEGDASEDSGLVEIANFEVDGHPDCPELRAILDF